MTRAIITGLGTIQVPKTPQDRPEYYLSKELKQEFSLKKKNYTNMLPLLLDNFREYGEIKCIYTDFSKEKQEEVLIDEDIKFDIKKNGVYISDKVVDTDDKPIPEAEYSYFLEQYNKLINQYDEVIIDLSHGFRHFPLLAIINIIINSIKDTDKIQHILYAKEIRQFKKYEIIDLIEYVDLAKLSFVLSAFNKNYTVGNSITFKNETYTDLVESLGNVSRHILANSLKQLIGEDTVITDTIDKLEKLLKEDKKINTFEIELKEILEHLEKIKNLDTLSQAKQYLQLAKMMKERDYLLNSITLLNESIGFFCVEKLKLLDTSIENHIDEYENHIEVNSDKNNNLYVLTSQSKNIIKLRENFTGEYLYSKKKISKLTSGQKTSLQKKKKKLKEKIPSAVINEISQAGFKISLDTLNIKNEKTIKELIFSKLPKNDKLFSLIQTIEDLRNNLAHGNSSESIENVKLEIVKAIKAYEKFKYGEIMQKNIATHNKIFHADEVLAIALLELFGEDEIIVHRVAHDTQDFSDYDMVIDIGRIFDGIKFFDHHQYRGGKSSAGLIWEYIGLEKEYPNISKLVKIVDNNDTGIAKAKPFEYASLIKCFNNSDIYVEEQDKAFAKAVDFAKTVLLSLKKVEDDVKNAKNIVANSFSFDNNPKILELDKFTPHWSSYINGELTPHIKAVVWEDKVENNYKVKIVPARVGSFELNAKALKPDKNMKFVHSAGFFAVAKDRENMIEYLKRSI